MRWYTIELGPRKRQGEHPYNLLSIYNEVHITLGQRINRRSNILKLVLNFSRTKKCPKIIYYLFLRVFLQCLTRITSSESWIWENSFFFSSHALMHPGNKVWKWLIQSIHIHTHSHTTHRLFYFDYSMIGICPEQLNFDHFLGLIVKISGHSA